MSWSITVDNIGQRDYLALTDDQQEYIGSQHEMYLSDMAEAFALAKAVGFASATLTGFRTPSPYGDDEVVDISVRGMMKAPDFNKEMQHIIKAGPDAPHQDT